MIENEVRDLLKADATLDTLLGSTSADSKIYPVIGYQRAVAPYLIVNSSLSGADELLDEDRIGVKIITGNDVAVMQALMDRVKILLDKNDDIQEVISQSTYRIFYSRMNGSVEAFLDDETNELISEIFFTVRFRKKST